MVAMEIDSLRTGFGLAGTSFYDVEFIRLAKKKCAGIKAALWR